MAIATGGRQQAANVKESEHSFFTQLADLLAFACLLKIRGEEGKLAPWQTTLAAHTLCDAVPPAVLNIWASRIDPQGIVRLR